MRAIWLRTLLGSALALVLARAGAASAQVYSLNIVGYVNVPLASGYNFIANQLDFDGTGTNNCITNTIPTAPIGMKVYVWNVSNQAFDPPSTYYSNAISHGWDIPALDLSPGKGFVIYAPYGWTNTFVGNVLQGWLTNQVAGNSKLSLLSYKVPISGLLSSDLYFPKLDGADIYTFQSASQTFAAPVTYFNPYGYFDTGGMPGTNGPTIQVAQGFFVRNPGPDTSWIAQFVVQRPEFPTQPPLITGLDVSMPGQVTLNVSLSPGMSCTVEYSTDRLTWTAVGSVSKSSIWSGPRSNDPQGYYRLQLM